MRDELVRYFETHQRLVEAPALERILENPQPLTLARELVEARGPESLFVTLEMVEAQIARDASRSGGRARAVSLATSSSPKGPSAPSFALVADGFSPLPEGRGPLEAYEAMFASRYETLSRLLRGRPEMLHARPIAELGNAERSAAVIAMVREVRTTPEQHHLILSVEDPSGVVELLVPHDSPAATLPYLPDEVVGLRLSLPRNRRAIARVESVQRPDVGGAGLAHRSSRTSRVIFLSDLHIGSRSFLDDAWGRLLDFLHQRGPSPELAAEVEHVVIAGDLVDGIGIYPGQERDLGIPDVFAQYRELGRRLRELPSRLNIVVIPGNHDAVCPAEPQPALPREISADFPENVRGLGNPSTFALDGVVIEAYHGRSFDDLIPALPGTSYARPTDVMKRMLQMRHLAPMYGGRTPLAPMARDGLVIDPSPDILVTGHSHTFGVDLYGGTLLLNASTWQAETEYQRMRNISPVPAHAAIVDLRTLAVSALDFLPATAEVPAA